MRDHMTFDVFPRFLFARMVLCVMLFDAKGFGAILEFTVPTWLDWTCLVAGILLSAHLCFRLVIGAMLLESLKKERTSE